MAATHECSVCCDDFSRSNVVMCSCGMTACNECTKKFIILSSRLAHCMQCKTEWGPKFLADIFTKGWLTSNKVGGYRHHRKEVALDREKSRIPETLADLPRIKEQEERRETIRQMEQRVVELKLELRETRDAIRDARNLAGQGAGEAAQKTPRFICPCPVEDCRGMIESKSFACGVCDGKVCRKCRESREKGDGHECNEDVVANLKLIRDDTKPCPSCATSIYKIEGCFDPDTSILLFDGRTANARDIKVGDALLGDDGEKRIVEEVRSGTDEMYEIRQNKADSYTVSSRHNLVLKYAEDRKKRQLVNAWKITWFDVETSKNKSRKFDTECAADEFLKLLGRAEPIELRVDEFLELAPSIQKCMYGYRSDIGVVGVPVIDTIDPYILGLWLGDGYANGTSFSLNEPETLRKVVSWAAEIGCEVVHEAPYRYSLRRPGYGSKCVAGEDPKCCDVCSAIEPVRLKSISKKTNAWKDILRAHNLLNNKHIPIKYMNADINTRRAILAGLIDSDGSASNGGKRIVVIQKVGTLGDQIASLGRSLGLCVHVSIRKIKNAIVMGADAKDYSDQYRINISGKTSVVQTLIPRKKCCDSEPNKDPLVTSLKVIPRGKGTYIGLRVSGSNKRFVLPDFTVVRNCDQMWCTQCRTAFSWRTGTIETGVIHNPHAVRWRREHGDLERDARDVPCGGLVQFWNIAGNLPTGFRKKFELMHRVVAETDQKINAHVPHDDFGDLRTAYVLKKKSEKEWQQSIFVRERTNDRKRANSQILQTFRSLGVERFRNLYETLQENAAVPAPRRGGTRTASQRSSELLRNLKARKEACTTFELEMEEIRTFINESFTGELPLLGTRNPLQIIDGWRWNDRTAPGVPAAEELPRVPGLGRGPRRR